MYLIILLSVLHAKKLKIPHLTAIHQSVVVRKCHIHHGPGLNLAAGHHHGALHDGVHAQNGTLQAQQIGRKIGEGGTPHCAIAHSLVLQKMSATRKIPGIAGRQHRVGTNSQHRVSSHVKLQGRVK